MREPIPGVSARRRWIFFGPLLGSALLLVGAGSTFQYLLGRAHHSESALQRARENTLVRQLRPDPKGLSSSLSPLVPMYIDRRYEPLLQAALALSSPSAIEEILIGNSLALHGQWEQAQSHYERVSAGPFRADAKANLALALLGSNHWNEAIAPALEALTEDTKQRNLSDQAGDLGTLGTLAFRLGDLAKAQGAHQAALRLAISANDPWHEAAERLSLGSLQFLQRRPEAALDQQKEALRLFQEMGESLGQVQALTAMGLAYKEAGNADMALGSFREAQRLARRMGDRESEGTSWINIALLEQERGRYGPAQSAGREALELAGDAPLQRAVALGTFAMIQKSAGNLPEAVRSLEEARSLFQQAGASQQLHGVETQLKMLKDQGSSSP